MRIGLGHDTHRLVPDRDLVLGGVKIDYEFGLDGHSDADALLHAIVDALLGAVGEGDIGDRFPDTDPQWKDADSVKFISGAVQIVRDHGYEIVNLDCNVFAEQPKLSPHKACMEQRIAEMLGIKPSQVNVKAKTGENVGPIGRGEAISTDAIVLVKPHKKKKKREPNWVMKDYEVENWGPTMGLIPDPESPFSVVEIKDADGKPIT